MRRRAVSHWLLALVRRFVRAMRAATISASSAPMPCFEMVSTSASIASTTPCPTDSAVPPCPPAPLPSILSCRSVAISAACCFRRCAITSSAAAIAACSPTSLSSSDSVLFSAASAAPSTIRTSSSARRHRSLGVRYRSVRCTSPMFSVGSSMPSASSPCSSATCLSPYSCRSSAISALSFARAACSSSSSFWRRRRSSSLAPVRPPMSMRRTTAAMAGGEAKVEGGRGRRSGPAGRPSSIPATEPIEPIEPLRLMPRPPPILDGCALGGAGPPEAPGLGAPPPPGDGDESWPEPPAFGCAWCADGVRVDGVPPLPEKVPVTVESTACGGAALNEPPELKERADCGKAVRRFMGGCGATTGALPATARRTSCAREGREERTRLVSENRRRWEAERSPRQPGGPRGAPSPRQPRPGPPRCR